jgi:lipopolysaccharide transport system ATP-binding protein
LLFGKSRKQFENKKIDKKVSSLDISSPKLSLDQDVFASRPGYNQLEYRWGDAAAKIIDFSMFSDPDNALIMNMLP